MKILAEPLGVLFVHDFDLGGLYCPNTEMALALEDIYRIAELAHIDIDEEQAVKMQGELNDIFQMIENIQAVDTTNVEPMMHPHDDTQRLREDKVEFGNNREENMKNAPEQYEGMFLVPRVVE